MSDRGWIRNRGRGRGGGNYGNSWRGGRNRDHPYGNSRGRFQSNSYRGRNQNNRFDRTKRDVPAKRLSEEDIGVTQYISDHSGFNGIIKSRYSDFQVSEINNDGEIAELTDESVPEPPAEEVVVEDEELLLCKYNVELLPMETWDRINKLAASMEPTSEKVEVDVTGMSKEHRTKIHDAVKKAFGDAIVGSTVTNDEKKFVSFEKYRKGIRIDNRVKWVWPGEYVYFIVHKENCDTMEAASKIAERLKLINVKPSMLGYAGTKDRRAKTSQWFSLRRVAPKRIAAACRDMRELHVGNFRFHNKELKLGMLKGNMFRIALRNVTAEEDVVDRACEDLRDKGFINYYGLQRFGTRIEKPTYEIGLQLLLGNFKDAINAILEERPGPLQPALHEYRRGGDAALAARLLPRYLQNGTLEGRLLLGLARNHRDLIGALSKLPRNNRLLYIHSYQSYVWNRCASERLRRLGLRPALGDLVLAADREPDLVPDSEDIQDDDDSEPENAQDNEADQDGDTDRDNSQPAEDIDTLKETANAEKKKNQHEPKPKVPVIVLTQEDVDSGKYSILDVVLPLPGYNIDYPPNMQDYYEELLTKDGLTLEMRHKYKSYSMSGTYRRLAVQPQQMSWSHVRYSAPHADLILSDKDKMRGDKLDGIVDDGKYKALLLTLTLPASCYATMALRELMKVDTSGDHQASQNNYHKAHEKGQGDTSVAVKEEIADAGEKRKLEGDGDAETEVKRLKQEVSECDT